MLIDLTNLALPRHRWCEGTLGVKKSTEETDSIPLN